METMTLTFTQAVIKTTTAAVRGMTGVGDLADSSASKQT